MTHMDYLSAQPCDSDISNVSCFDCKHKHIIYLFNKHLPSILSPPHTQKLAGGKNPWFLDSWNSKDTKNDSSLDYEDAKDLPIELRRLEDFDDIPEPLSSAGLKSRSLGSILANPPPKQIVRSRSSVPSLGMEMKQTQANSETMSSSSAPNTSTVCTPSSSDKRRPKLIKQKQSITDDPDFLFGEGPGNPYKNISSTHNDLRAQLLRKQSSLNEELMAESRIREKERIRKKIQKQMSLNETFLCRSVFSKRLQVIREGFTTKIKTSTGSLERVTKSGIVKIIENIKNASNTSQSHQQSNENGTGHHANSSSARNGPMRRRLSSNGGSLERNSSLNEIERIRRNSRESGSGEFESRVEIDAKFTHYVILPIRLIQRQQPPVRHEHRVRRQFRICDLHSQEIRQQHFNDIVSTTQQEHAFSANVSPHYALSHAH